MKPEKNGLHSSDLHTSERRRATRLHAKDGVIVHVPAQEIEGRLDNVSVGGVLFFSEESLQVTVEIEEDGVVKELSGRIVRAQRTGTTVGWAVELDGERR